LGPGYSFAKFGWGGTAYLTGSIITLAMFFIYTGAPNSIRFAKVSKGAGVMGEQYRADA
jgi:hypothetical protein